MRRCIGYLNQEEQIAWLRKAKAALDNVKSKYTKTKPPVSFIFVLEYVDERNKTDKLRIQGQTVETAKYYS